MQSDTDRFAGYRQILEQADIGFQPELVTHGDGRPEGGMRAMTTLMALEARPTAVFCYNDMSALGAMYAAQEQKLRVPADLSVVGVDDLFLASYTRPPLTTVQQPKQQIGRMAARILLELLSGGKPDSHVTVTGQLVVRRSSGPPGEGAR
jgi:DNA-binding LacI/PurR family transcriptional regulator